MHSAISFSFLAVLTLSAAGVAAQAVPPEPAASGAAEASHAPRPEPAIEYLANEGVLLTAGDVSVLIDALFGDGLPGYPVVHLERQSSAVAGRLAERIPSAVILDQPGKRIAGDC